MDPLYVLLMYSVWIWCFPYMFSGLGMSFKEDVLFWFVVCISKPCFSANTNLQQIAQHVKLSFSS